MKKSINIQAKIHIFTPNSLCLVIQVKYKAHFAVQREEICGCRPVEGGEWTQGEGETCVHGEELSWSSLKNGALLTAVSPSVKLLPPSQCGEVKSRRGRGRS